MKTSRIAALALIATVAGFNAQAQEIGINYESMPPVKYAPSTLTRAQVTAQAIAASKETLKRDIQAESEPYFGAPVQAPSSQLTREQVRADVLKARATTIAVPSFDIG